MNIFEGARRVGKVAAGFVVLGYIVYVERGINSTFYSRITINVISSGDLVDPFSEECLLDFESTTIKISKPRNAYIKLCYPKLQSVRLPDGTLIHNVPTSLNRKNAIENLVFRGFDTSKLDVTPTAKGLPADKQSSANNGAFSLLPSGTNEFETLEKKYGGSSIKSLTTEMLSDRLYIDSSLNTKMIFFDKFIATDIAYTSANSATKSAIRKRFGLIDSSVEERIEGEAKNQNSVAFSFEQKTAIEKAKARLEISNGWGVITHKHLFLLSSADSNKSDFEFTKIFKLSQEGEDWINQEWLDRVKELLIQAIIGSLSCLAFLWIFSLGVGWILRGFLGIPNGKDERVS